MVDEEVNEDSNNGGGSMSIQERIAAVGKTVVFFDYDDTLLASSHLSAQGYSLDSTKEFTPEIAEELRQLEALVIRTLEAALQFSQVFIVTNAETGWVQLSAKKFMPGLLPVLEKVTVISARSTFEKIHGNNPLKWKFCAFQDALQQAYGSMDTVTKKNILSFGDSNVEREAVRAVTRGYENVRMKSIKFQERPTMEQLRRQLLLIERSFHSLCAHDGDLDLQLTVYPLEEAAAQQQLHAQQQQFAHHPGTPIGSYPLEVSVDAEVKTNAAGVPSPGAAEEVAYAYPPDLFAYSNGADAADDSYGYVEEEEYAAAAVAAAQHSDGSAFHYGAAEDVRDFEMQAVRQEGVVVDG